MVVDNAVMDYVIVNDVVVDGGVTMDKTSFTLSGHGRGRKRCTMMIIMIIIIITMIKTLQ